MRKGRVVTKSDSVYMGSSVRAVELCAKINKNKKFSEVHWIVLNFEGMAKTVGVSKDRSEAEGRSDGHWDDHPQSSSSIVSSSGFRDCEPSLVHKPFPEDTRIT